MNEQHPDHSIQPEAAANTSKPFGQFTRRTFIAQLGAAGVAATASPALGRTVEQNAPTDPAASHGAQPVTLRVNGKDLNVSIEPRVTLLDCLR
jgi:xanthine dehydrogenase YagT iron-sulfur-binding subunit